MYSNRSRLGEGSILGIGLIVVLILGVILSISSCTVIQPGQVGVQVTFGSVNDNSLGEGMHVVNPMSKIVDFDVRQQSHTEDNVNVTSQDQLVSQLDVSIQYTLNPKLAAKILKEIGDIERVKTIVLVPKIRSALREATKTIKEAKDYATNETQTKLQTFIEVELKSLLPMGIVVSEVLVRDIQLPKIIVEAVNASKLREQATISQQFELDRFKVEQKQKVEQATAEKDAATQAALRMRIEADAEAYKIGVLNAAAAASPVYVQLKALETLNELSKNPAHKIFFIDGKGQYPVPLLHMGDSVEGSQVGPVAPSKK